MDITEFGITIEANDMHPKKHSHPIEVTWESIKSETKLVQL
jgi:hypothetical protein